MKVEQLAKLIWDELQGWGKLDAYFFAIVAGCLGADEETFKQAETFGSDPPEAFLMECGFGDDYDEIMEFRRDLTRIAQKLEIINENR